MMQTPDWDEIARDADEKKETPIALLERIAASPEKLTAALVVLAYEDENYLFDYSGPYVTVVGLAALAQKHLSDAPATPAEPA
jgi:hypothetical protein